MRIRDVVFDLDGTLIDSAASILESIQVALAGAGIHPIQSITPSLIGPPLEQVLKQVIGQEQEKHLPLIKKHFMQHYDNCGYMKTQPYDGIPKLLDSLRVNSIRISVATNKRIAPTSRIIQYLGWQKFFAQVLALDSFSPPVPSKGVMLIKLAETMVSPSHSIYVGDLPEDAAAAKEAGLDFVFAEWGYGNVRQSHTMWKCARTPSDLEQFLIEKSIVKGPLSITW